LGLKFLDLAIPGVFCADAAAAGDVAVAFSTLSALGSILKLQVCNFAEIKRSYENSTGTAEAVDRSGSRSVDLAAAIVEHF